MKKLIFGLLILLLATTANAQISTTTCPGAGCQDFPLGNNGSVGIQVTGTWVGTITFQASINNGTFATLLVLPIASTTAVSTTTGNGIWNSSIAGLATVRVVFTAYTSGSATVTFKSVQSAKSNGGGSGGGGSGTVTSVDIVVPAILTVSGGPVTSSGTISIDTATEAANKILSGPTTGADAQPTFRTLVAADIPSLTYAPVNATYITQTANGTLTNEQALASLATGILKSTTTTGVLSIAAAGTDYEVPLTFTGGLTRSTNSVSVTCGADKQILFKDGTTCAGSVVATLDKTTELLTLTQSSETFNSLLSLTVTGGVPVVMYPYANGSFEMDLSTTMFLTGDVAAVRWVFGGDVLVSTGNKLYIDSSGVSLGATRVGVYRLMDNAATSSNGSIILQHDITNTISTSGMVNLSLNTDFGHSGAASVGNGTNLSNVMHYTGSGSATNEPAPEYSVLSVDIGTGFTQTTGPTGRFWFKDLSVYGPIAVQPATLNGITMRMQNNYNGSPATTPSAAMWMVNTPSGGLDNNHISATAYPIDVGLGIVGVSSASGIGFTTAIQIGGTGSPWNEAASKFANGITVRDYTTRGLYINNPSGTPTAAIETTTGNVIFGGVTKGLHLSGNGSAPAVTNTTANSCGTTAASLVGSDNGGKVTVGATAGTSCTVTFAVAYANAPACTVTNETTANLVRATSTTTTVILAGTMVAGDKLAFQCVGY